VDRRPGERSAGDPGIIGEKIYDPHTGVLLGRAQLAAPYPGRGTWVVIVKDDDTQAINHLELTTVLISVVPTLDATHIEPDPDQESLPPLPEREQSGHPVSTEGRQRIIDRAELEGEGFVEHREPGVSDEDAPLPGEEDPDPDPEDRPRGKHHHPEATIYPTGKPLGRQTENGAPSGGTPKTGGTSTMSNVAEVQAAINAAMAIADEAMAMARGAIDKLTEAQQRLAATLESSTHEYTVSALAAMNHANEQFGGGIQAIMGAKEQAEQYGAGL
jgi:hypothetical protein